MTITVSEAQKKKRLLEAEILAAIKRFECETGLEIDHIRTEGVCSMGFKTETVAVFVDVRL